MENTNGRKKTRVYECAHFEHERGETDSFSWCNCGGRRNECGVKLVYCMKFCPNFAKGKLRGAWEISPFERKEAAEMKAEIREKIREQEAAERALYERLRKKYGN